MTLNTNNNARVKILKTNMLMLLMAAFQFRIRIEDVFPNFVHCYKSDLLC